MSVHGRDHDRDDSRLVVHAAPLLEGRDHDACPRNRAGIIFGWVFFLISFGSPHVRPMGRTCGEQSEIELTSIGVKSDGSWRVPGLTTLARTPDSARSRAAHRVSWSMAAWVHMARGDVEEAGARKRERARERARGSARDTAREGKYERKSADHSGGGQMSVRKRE